VQIRTDATVDCATLPDTIVDSNELGNID